MTPRLQILAIVCLTALSLVLGMTIAGAAPADRKTLVLRGRIVDGDGWPVAGARVVMSGDRRASTQTDASGQFELQVALGAVNDVARRPIALRVAASQRGWRITLPGGDAELGIELRTSAGDDGVVRCEIRSNQPRVTAALARLLLSDDELAIGPVGFAAEHGEPADAATSLTLGAVDRVALAGVSPALLTPSLESTPKPEKPKAAAPEKEKTPNVAIEKTKVDKTKADKTKVEKTTTSAPSEDSLRTARQQERAAAAAQERRKRDEAREHERQVKLAQAEAAARAKEQAKQEKMAARAKEQEQQKTAAAALAAMKSTAGKPVATKPAQTATRVNEPIASTRPVDLPATTAAPAGDPAADSSSGHTPKIIPPPEGQPRARARPMLIRNPAVEEPPTPTTEPCGCRIEGTVEVRSDRPLASRVRVAVSLPWYPALADTVELFMGSPRGFVIPVAPCGPERLKVTVLGSQKFDVVSRDAMAGFKCQAGELHHLRVVLQPR